MNLELSKNGHILDKLMLKLREFLKMQYGDKFDDGYLKIREKNPSKLSKLSLFVPLFELCIYSFFTSQASNQGKQINIMGLTRSYNKHYQNVVETYGLDADFKI